jgi:hypothetical protein
VTITWRSVLAWIVGATLIATGVTLVVAGPSIGAALPAPQPGPAIATHAPASGNAHASRNGDNGTVKIHRSTTAVTDPRNEPHVCVFYLDAFGFDAGQVVSWMIKSWPPTGDRTVVAQGGITLDSNGDGRTDDMTLPDGHYKLYWNFTGEKGFAKQKVFWVSCGVQTSPPPPPPSSPPPSCTPPPPQHHATPTCTPPPSSSPPATPSSPPPPQSPTSSPSLSNVSNGGMPITGWPLALIIGSGLALLGAGAISLVLARRKRGLPSSR